MEFAKDKEILTGRKKVLFVYPFSFEEILECENPELFTIENMKLTKTYLHQLFLKCITYGIDPRMILEDNIGKKTFLS